MKSAIMVTREVEGWTWALVDEAGVTTARGVGKDLESSMEMAWRSARAGAAAQGEPPDLFIEHNGALDVTPALAGIPGRRAEA